MDIRIVPFEGSHSPRFEAMLGDPDVKRFTRLPDPAPADFAATWLSRYAAGRADGTREAFAIVDGDDFLGIAVAPTIDPVARESELGYVVAPWARRRGVATTALTLLTRWAFEERGIARAYLLISVGNEGSKEVARRCGYSFEGVLRSLWFKGDLREDTESWSRLPDDPDPA